MLLAKVFFLCFFVVIREQKRQIESHFSEMLSFPVCDGIFTLILSEQSITELKNESGRLLLGLEAFLPNTPTSTSLLL